MGSGGPAQRQGRWPLPRDEEEGGHRQVRRRQQPGTSSSSRGRLARRPAPDACCCLWCLVCRAESCDIRIQLQWVSRRHAELNLLANGKVGTANHHCHPPQARPPTHRTHPLTKYCCGACYFWRTRCCCVWEPSPSWGGSSRA